MVKSKHGDKEKMRRKNLLIKIAGILSLFFLIIIYVLLYLFPALKSINQYKRQLKDMNLKISDFATMESDFSFSDERERSYFARTDRELSGKIAEVKTREDFIALITTISNYIKNLAEKDGILKLVMKPDESQKGAPAKGFSGRLKNVKSHTITLSFTGKIKNAVNFINHIPWIDYYLSEDRILVSAGDIFPFYIVFLMVYYIDLQEQAAGVEKDSQENQESLIIDYDSEVLLNPIDPELTEPFPKKELPPGSGRMIFTKRVAPDTLRKGQQ
jgi:hypothetical protein